MKWFDVGYGWQSKMVIALLVLCGCWIGCGVEPTAADDPKPLDEHAIAIDDVKDGIHVRTGLIAAPGLTQVIGNCTPCHSAKLITQNRMNRDGWISTIDWMQRTQNLWDLGENQDSIINYLVANYPPSKAGRRKPLPAPDWYPLQ